MKNKVTPRIMLGPASRSFPMDPVHPVSIDCAIINDVGINDSRTKPVPAKVSLRLHAFKDESICDLDFTYRSVVGKLNYLAQTTPPDIMYAIH